MRIGIILLITSSLILAGCGAAYTEIDPICDTNKAAIIERYGAPRADLGDSIVYPSEYDEDRSIIWTFRRYTPDFSKPCSGWGCPRPGDTDRCVVDCFSVKNS